VAADVFRDGVFSVVTEAHIEHVRSDLAHAKTTCDKSKGEPVSDAFPQVQARRLLIVV
jgi:hypothetical protein